MNGTWTPDQAAYEERMLLSGPAGPPPVGVSSNFVDPPNQDAAVIAICTIFLLLVTLAGMIRLNTKSILIRSFEYEDYVLTLAWFGLIPYTVLTLLWIQSGGGKHVWDIQLKSLERLSYLTNTNGIVYCITIFLVRASILLQYLRVFIPNRKADWSLYIAIRVALWINFSFYFAILFVQIFACNPREKIWNFFITNGHCVNSYVSSLISGIFNVLSDFCILILPMVPIFKLQLPLRKKLLLIAVFATGIFACAISITGTYYRRTVEDSQDSSYDLVKFGLWTEAEVVIGFLLSCAPIMPRFFQHVGPKLYATLSRNSSSKARTALEPNSNGCGNANIKSPPPFKYPQDKFGGIRHTPRITGNSFDPLTTQTGDYVTLDDLGDTRSKEEVRLEDFQVPPPKTVIVHGGSQQDVTAMV